MLPVCIISSGDICSLLYVCFLDGYGFLSGGKRYRRETWHACSTSLLSGQVFFHFGELWFAWSHGGGITFGMNYIEVAVGQSELGAAPSHNAVWWGMRLASLLTHLFVSLYGYEFLSGGKR